MSCPTLCNPMDCSPPGFSVCVILQARILEWVAIPFSRGASQHRDQNTGLLHCSKFFYRLNHQVVYLFFFQNMTSSGFLIVSLKISTKAPIRKTEFVEWSATILHPHYAPSQVTESSHRLNLCKFHLQHKNSPENKGSFQEPQAH